MPFHLLPYYTAAFNNSSLTNLDVVLGDPYFQPNTSIKAYVSPKDVMLLSAFCGAGNITQARVVAPVLLRGSYMSITPLETSASPSGDIGIAQYLDRPVKLTGGEPISVQCANTAAANAAAALICGFDMTPVPAGEAYWIRYSSGTTATAGAMKTLGLTAASYDTTLPAGTYIIIGMDHWSATAVAARLILDSVRYRPGLIAHSAAGASRSHEMFYQGHMGVWGYFTNRVMPDVEVLCTAADTAHVGYLYVMRVGDADLLGSLTGSGR